MSLLQRGSPLPEERLEPQPSPSPTARKQALWINQIFMRTNSGLPREDDAGEYYCLLAGEESSVSTSCRWHRSPPSPSFFSSILTFQADGVKGARCSRSAAGARLET